ncbi:unnamed protein product [Allacma fusca]|uniref:Uncharacterized protein n=1 Tax=Allacma fusca TaxID=39272 RepID=A0A8J2NLH7_9HEXA|nr:unnamed protein product [Allacma fusca]
MLVSFLTCDYIEKFVVKTFCSIKNRRRRYRERSIPIAGHSGKKRKKSHSSSEMATKDNETPAVSQGQGPNVSQNVLGTPGTHSQSFVFDEPPPAYYECTRTQTSQSGHKAKNE